MSNLNDNDSYLLREQLLNDERFVHEAKMNLVYGEIKIRYDLCYLMEPEAILVDHDIREYPDGIKDVKYIFDVW